MRTETTIYQDLLLRLKTFDLDAFGEVYTQFRERLFVYAFAIIKDETAAQDLVQDLFIDFWQKQAFLNIHSGLPSYLVRSVRNNALDYLNKEKTRQKLQQQFTYLESGKYLSSDQIENAELGEEIKEAVAKLPPMPAKVFQMHYIDKLAYNDIAEQLNISRSTVSNHMTRALKLLRDQLKKLKER